MNPHCCKWWDILSSPLCWIIFYHKQHPHTQPVYPIFHRCYYALLIIRLISLLISLLHWLFKDVLSDFHVFVSFLKFPFYCFLFVYPYGQRRFNMISVCCTRVWPVTRGRTLNLKTENRKLFVYGGISWYTCGHRKSSGVVLPLLPCWRQGLLFAAVYSKLAGPWSCRDSLVFGAHLCYTYACYHSCLSVCSEGVNAGLHPYVVSVLFIEPLP